VTPENFEGGMSEPKAGFGPELKKKGEKMGLHARGVDKYLPKATYYARQRLGRAKGTWGENENVRQGGNSCKGGAPHVLQGTGRVKSIECAQNTGVHVPGKDKWEGEGGDFLQGHRRTLSRNRTERCRADGAVNRKRAEISRAEGGGSASRVGGGKATEVARVRNQGTAGENLTLTE